MWLSLDLIICHSLDLQPLPSLDLDLIVCCSLDLTLWPSLDLIICCGLDLQLRLSIDLDLIICCSLDLWPQQSRDLDPIVCHSLDLHLRPSLDLIVCRSNHLPQLTSMATAETRSRSRGRCTGGRGTPGEARARGGTHQWRCCAIMDVHQQV